MTDVPLNEVCDCASMPVNRWQLSSGEWIDGGDIGRNGLFGAPQAAEEDGQRYNELGCVAWRIVCPECGQLYAAGATYGPSWRAAGGADD